MPPSSSPASVISISAALASLDGIRALFTQDQALLVGWLHFLAFDLFVGAWEVRDSRALGINHFLVLPCLFFTFMFGPVGFLLYLILRTVMKQRFLAPAA